MYDQASKLRELAREKQKQKDTARARTITVASGKGGVGKSNLVINLALALEKIGKKVLIIDVDIGMGNVEILLDINPSYDLGNVLRNECSLGEAVISTPYGPDVLGGITGEEFGIIALDEIYSLLATFSKFAGKYDIILLDSGAGGSSNVLNFILAADETLIVLTPEPTSVMDAYSLIKIMKEYNFDNRLSLLINMVSSGFEGRKITSRMSDTILEYLQLEVENTGCIPYDECVKKSIKSRVPLLVEYPESSAGRSIVEFTQSMVGEVEDKDYRGIKGFVFRLIGHFHRD